MKTAEYCKCCGHPQQYYADQFNILAPSDFKTDIVAAAKARDVEGALRITEKFKQHVTDMLAAAAEAPMDKVSIRIAEDYAIVDLNVINNAIEAFREGHPIYSINAIIAVREIIKKLSNSRD